MAFTVQPFVGEEKLWELLAQQTESDCLDYKSQLNLRETRDVCELAKDVGAMQIRGGYIVIGADGRGEPTGKVPNECLRLFDEATLRAKLLKYLPDNIELLSATHSVNRKNLVLIYVGPNPDGFAIFKVEGKHPGGCAFRKGDVYSRHGSSSSPWSQADALRVIAGQVAKAKEEWFAERRAEKQAEEGFLTWGLTDNPTAEQQPQDLSWDLDEKTLRDTVISHLRRGDDIPLKLFFNGLANDAAELLGDPDRSAELSVLLDRLTCVAALLIELDEETWLNRAIDTLVAIYDLGFDDQGLDKQLSFGRERLWLMVIERAVALGGFAVRKRMWACVRYLATRAGHGQYFMKPRKYYFSWLRHGLTMAARIDLFGEGSLISLAHTVAQQEECLRPGLTKEDESLLTSICQFDGLAMLATIDSAGRNDVYYPSFSRYYEHRTQPALAALVHDEQMRATIFPRSDQELADAIRYIDETARSEGFRFAGWESIHDTELRTFLEEHPET